MSIVSDASTPSNGGKWEQTVRWCRCVRHNRHCFISPTICLNFNYIPLWTKSSTPSFREIELTMHFPWEHFRPASITAKSEESMHNGTFEISGSDEIKLQNYRPVHVLLSRFYLYYILTLSRFYPNFIKIEYE